MGLMPPLAQCAFVIGITVGCGFVVATHVVVRAALTAPLPYEAPGSLVELTEVSSGTSGPLDRSLIIRLAENDRVFAGVAGYIDGSHRLGRHVEPDRATTRTVAVTRITPSLFAMLGLRPVRGRMLELADGVPRDRMPALVSERLIHDGLWSGSPGDSIHLDDVPYEVVGVMAGHVWFPNQDTRVWIPLVMTPTVGVTWRATTLARLRPGVTLAAAQVALQSLAGAARLEVA